jgi:DNA-binding transcriptional ArsR family regulator
MFIAAHSRGGWVSWRLPHTYALVYPVAGVLAAGPAPLPEPLVRLLGRTRARLLVALDAPRSTSALVAQTGLPLGSVGGHLRVLLDAGLLERRRSGREVLYWRSDTGSALLDAPGSSWRHRGRARRGATSATEALSRPGAGAGRARRRP